MRRHALLMLVVLAIAATATPIKPLLGAEGSKRLALVVGNSAYKNVAPLVNPANDATDIAQKLKSLGFEVLLATNADQGKMSSLLQEFRNKLTREHAALIFFAGHGVTVNSESFLIPVDVTLPRSTLTRKATRVPKRYTGTSSAWRPCLRRSTQQRLESCSSMPAGRTRPNPN